MAQGKAHKSYEFGNKVGLVTTAKKNMILTAIKSFKGNPHDSKTIKTLLDQAHGNLGCVPQEVIYDRASRGQNQIGDTVISTPSNPLKRDSACQKRKNESNLGEVQP